MIEKIVQIETPSQANSYSRNAKILRPSKRGFLVSRGTTVPEAIYGEKPK
jgi:hypothetical protein